MDTRIRSLVVLLAVFQPSATAENTPADAQEIRTLDEAVNWLKAKSHAMIRASRREMASGIAAFPPQAGAGYERFWLRDYCYMLEGCTSAFSEKELRDACLLFVEAMRADGAGVDSVGFDGTPFYKPGGDGQLGENPVADGSQFTVAVAWHTHRRLQDRKFLMELIDRLIHTIKAVPRNPLTGLVYIRPEGHDRCPYGFTDTVRKQGDELFCSLLLIQAHRQLADLLRDVGRADEAQVWSDEAVKLERAVRKTFWDDEVGLFRAATIQCKEPDLWGSAFCVYLGVASKAQALKVASYFREHYAEIIQRGQLRHLPGGMYWEAAAERDAYQNGGYWGTPIGWFVYTLDLVDAKLADQTVIDMVRDFQQRGVTEWVFGDRTAVQNYIVSAALPLAGINEMRSRRASRLDRLSTESPAPLDR